MTQRLSQLVAALAVAGAVACAPPQRETATPQTTTSRPLPERPERKAILEALLANLDVRLSVHQSCMGVGTDADDETIGAYVSGFLAEFDGDDSRNWIETRAESASSASGEPVWRADVMLRHAAGDDEWGWGVRFDLAKADGRVVRESFQCLGAG